MNDDRFHIVGLLGLSLQDFFLLRRACSRAILWRSLAASFGFCPAWSGSLRISVENSGSPFDPTRHLCFKRW